MRTIKTMLVIFLFGISITGFSQRQEVQIKTTKITDQFYMLEGQGGNIGIFIGDDAIFMIDDQFAPITPKILAAIKKITPKKVDYLINTHWHGDHTGGNENMSKEGALIFAHDNVRKRMSKESTRWGRKVPASPEAALPVITFDKDMTFHINGDDILAIHVHNAHTDGDALIYFANNNVLHTGDSYFQKGFPYIDLTSGGSIDGYIEGIQKMLLLIDDDTKVVPGHGKVSSKAELKTYLEMLNILKSRVLAEIKKGKTLEEVKTNASITKGYESQSWWITEERIRETIYTSLKNK